MKEATVRVLALQTEFDDFQDFGDLDAAMGGVFVVFMLFSLVVGVLVIAGMWKTFTKAGQPGWAAIIPIYNLYVLDEIAERPAWWLVLWLIPCVNIAPAIVVPIDVAQRFGKGTGFGLGLVFLGPIFYPILGFGSAHYQPRSPGQAPVA